MRIAFVTHQFPPRYVTGTELYAARLARRLIEACDLEVFVHTVEPSFADGPGLVREEDGPWEGLPVTRAFVRPELAANPVLASYYDVAFGKRFAAWLDRVRPDVVHVFHLMFHGASILEEAWLGRVPVILNLMDHWLVCPTAQLARRPSLAPCDGPAPLDCLGCLAEGDATFAALARHAASDAFPGGVPAHDPGSRVDPSNDPGPYARLSALAARPAFLREVVLRTADRLVSPSETLRDEFVAQGYPRERIALVRYGVDPMPERGATPAGALRIGFVGSLNPPKGADVLVEAVSTLDEDVTLDVHGDPAPFPQYVRGLQERAAGDPRVRFCGRLEPEDLPAALGALDVLAVPSRWRENTPFVVLEAHAAGIPVVASDVPGIAEIVRPGVDGLLVPPGDPAALREALRSLAVDPAHRAALTGRARGGRSLLDNARDFARMYAEVAARG